MNSQPQCEAMRGELRCNFPGNYGDRQGDRFLSFCKYHATSRYERRLWDDPPTTTCHAVMDHSDTRCMGGITSVLPDSRGLCKFHAEMGYRELTWNAR